MVGTILASIQPAIMTDLESFCSSRIKTSYLSEVEDCKQHECSKVMQQYGVCLEM